MVRFSAPLSLCTPLAVLSLSEVDVSELAGSSDLSN